MSRWVVALLAVAGAGGGCSGGTDKTPGPTGPIVDPMDQDGDHFDIPGDCDDADPAVHPGAEDPPYDGVDADCSGGSDYDADHDGFDSAEHGGDDCADADPAIHPEATEVCNAVDDDCDGSADGPYAEGVVVVYTDADHDGYGAGEPIFACETPPDAADNTLDCDDDNPASYPGATPIPCDGSDNDCLDTTDEPGAVALDGAPAADLASAVAAAAPGSLIELCEGRYAVQGVVIADELTIRGLGGPITVLDASGTGPALTVETTAPVTLEALTLTGGIGRNLSGARRGGGLYVGAGGQVSASDLHVTGNVAGEGGGIWLGEASTFTLAGGTVSDNHALDRYAIAASGGGIATEDYVGITLEDSTIEANDAQACGGLDLGRATLVDGSGTTTIVGNAELGLGGGGVCATGGATLRDLTLEANDALNSGGALFGGDVLLESVDVRFNTSALDGGGLYLFGDNTLVDCTIEGNVAGVDGGGIFTTGTVSIEASVVHANEATFFSSLGGGVAVTSGILWSVDTDWGVGASDNSPDDVSLLQSALGSSWDGVATFTCDDAFGTCE